MLTWNLTEEEKQNMYRTTGLNIGLKKVKHLQMFRQETIKMYL